MMALLVLVSGPGIQPPNFHLDRSVQVGLILHLLIVVLTFPVYLLVFKVFSPRDPEPLNIGSGLPNQII